MAVANIRGYIVHKQGERGSAVGSPVRNDYRKISPSKLVIDQGTLEVRADIRRRVRFFEGGEIKNGSFHDPARNFSFVGCDDEVEVEVGIVEADELSPVAPPHVKLATEPVPICSTLF